MKLIITLFKAFSQGKLLLYLKMVLCVSCARDIYANNSLTDLSVVIPKYIFIF